VSGTDAAVQAVIHGIEQASDLYAWHGLLLMLEYRALWAVSTRGQHVVDVGGGMFGTAASEAAAGIRTFALSPDILPRLRFQV